MQRTPNVSGITNILNLWNGNMTCRPAILNTSASTEGLISFLLYYSEL